MKIKNILSVSLLIFATSFSGLSAVNNIRSINDTFLIEQNVNNVITHVVSKGETIYSIAAKYNTTVESIYKLNPQTEKGIREGDKLQLQKALKVSGYSNHQIEAKETLFSVSRMYNVSIDDLKRANPGLNESAFSIGRIIQIPTFNSSSNVAVKQQTNGKSEYKVMKGETLYSISKKQNVSVDGLFKANPDLKSGGLKEGMILTIPNAQTSFVAGGQEPLLTDIPYASAGETVRVGLLFPFNDKNSSVSSDKLVEYYEGFLLALKELKEKGLNAEIYTFDIGTERNTKKLESLLGTNEIKNLHLLIGGVSKPQIDLLTKFSEKAGIKYAIPFGSVDKINIQPNLFQITTSHSSLYSEVIAAFKQKFDYSNIIFVSESGSNNDRSDFVNELKKELTRSNIQFSSIISSANLSEDISKSLTVSRKNILIPTSSSEVTLRKIITAANLLNAEDITLFGYPEWQTYTQHTESLHKYNSYIYSIFFLDEQDKKVQEFAANYKNWYNRNLINSYPKYGYLGYDTGLYFLTALHKSGSRFENNLSNLRVPTLQSAIHFVQESRNGGFINDGLYLIHFEPGSKIEKIDISK